MFIPVPGFVTETPLIYCANLLIYVDRSRFFNESIINSLRGIGGLKISNVFKVFKASKI